MPKANITLRELTFADTAVIANLANNKNIWDNVRDRMPFPYKEEDAENFIKLVLKEDGPEVRAIVQEGVLKGLIGLHPASDVYRAGGRNKMVAAKAYDIYNTELEPFGLKINIPETIWDVSKEEIPLWVQKLGGQAVIKIPYSNAGQGVFTIINEQELEAFMAQEIEYKRFIVQSLIGNYNWSSTSSADGQLMRAGEQEVDPQDFDVVFLRLPRPVTDEYLLQLEQLFERQVIINRPSGIIETSSKAFLLELGEVCPPMRLVRSVDDVLAFAEEFPIVLKPLRGYGGAGVLKVNGNKLDDGNAVHDTREYLQQLTQELEEDGMLAMQFLKNVSQGDKRTIVVAGEIMASSLRMPATDSWLCNVAQGGTSVPAVATEEEVEMIATIHPKLEAAGILIYGVDTLVNDDGKRVLSEEDGPVLGLTAAVHGNELNGISVIQRLFTEIDPQELRGTIVGAPVVNVPSFMRKMRRFNDGVDINHIMPGKADGNVSQVYAYRFFNRLVRHFDYLLDLHTASFGRINSYYIRADMDTPVVRKMALLQNADIIVHNPPSDGTLRGAADELGIPAITLEVGNPNTFQRKLIRSGITGIHNVLCHLEMVDDEIDEPQKETVICSSSRWLYTEMGGLLTVHLAGCALSIIVDYKQFEGQHTYEEVTGDYSFNTHTPQGDMLYGIDVFIKQEFRGLRLGRRLYDYRKELCEKLNLKGIAFGGRMPNYHKYADDLSPKEYIAKVRRKEIHDPVLNFQISNDFHPTRILRGYLEGDGASNEFAVLMEWDNIYYEAPTKKAATNKRVVRLGLIQWQMRPYKDIDELLQQAEFFIDAVSDYRSDFALFPEFFNAPLMAENNHLPEPQAIHGERKMGLPFETEEYYYLIRMTPVKAENIIEEDDDYDDDGNLKAKVKARYEDKYDDLDFLDDLNSNDDNDLGGDDDLEGLEDIPDEVSEEEDDFDD
eukprot:g394.t1